MNDIQKKAMPLWFKLLAGFSVISLCGVILGILFTERWVGVVENQLHELKEGDIEQAYYQYTSKDFQLRKPLEEFRAFINAHPILFHNPSTHFANRSLHRNISTLTGQLRDEDHKTIPIQYRLIKEEGEWKILSINFLDNSPYESPKNK